MTIRPFGLVLLCLMALGAAMPVRAQESTGSSAIYPVLVDGKWGFISEAGDVIAPPSYDSLQGLRFTIPGCTDLRYASNVLGADGPVAVAVRAVSSGLKWGFVGPSGEIVPPVYDKVYGYHDGVAAVSRNGKWGFIDTSGSEVIPFDYDFASGFRGGVSVVMVDGWWGLIDRDGNYVVEPEYDVIHALTHGPYFMFETKGKQGILHASGEVIADAMFDQVYVLSEGLLSVQLNGAMGYYDVETQEFAIEPQFDLATPFESGVAMVRKDGLVAFIDRNGDFTFEPLPSEKRPRADFLVYEYAPSNPNSIYRYRIQPKRELKWGLIDATDGTVIIEPQFDSIGQIVEGRALFRAGTLTGYLDAKGNIVIPASFEQAFEFSGGLAYARASDRVGYIDTQGSYIIEFDDINLRGSPFRPNLAFVYGDGRERYIDRDGNEVYAFRSGCN